MTDLFSLSGKIALLTGAAGFFGRHFSRALLQAGAATVILIDQKRGDLEQLAGDLTADFGSGKALVSVIDQYDREKAGAAFRGLAGVYEVSVLINNAFDFSERTGFNTPAGRLENATYEQLITSFEATLYWAFQTTQIFGLAMKKAGRGSIINICTMYADSVPNPALYEGTTVFNPPGYSAGKGALLQFTRYSAAWLAPVRVNAISPGAFPHEPGTHNAPSDIVNERLKQKMLIKRMGHPRDLIGALIFLASDASSYVTGENIGVDGGITVAVT